MADQTPQDAADRAIDSEDHASAAAGRDSASAVAQANGGENAATDWLTRLVEADEQPRPSPAATAPAPKLPPPPGATTRPVGERPASVEPPPSQTAQSAGTGLGSTTKILAAVLAVETVAILGYFMFRPAPEPAVFRLPAGQLAAPAATQNTAKSATTSDSAPSTVAAAGAQEVVVAADGSGRFATISQALEQSPPGTRILVKPGRYREQLTLAEPVEIIGDGPREEIIVEAGSGALLTLKTTGAVVRGLTLVRSKGVDEGANYAVEIVKGAPRLEDCDITSEQGECIYVRGVDARPQISKCMIHDGSRTGFSFADGAGGEVVDCDIKTMQQAAVLLKENANPTFRNCRWLEPASNCILIRSSRGSFLDCTIAGGPKPTISVEDGSTPVFRGCKVEIGENTAIQIAESQGLYEKCEFISHDDGVTVLKKSAPVFRDCTIADNKDDALIVEQESTGLFERCTVRGNGESVWVVSGSSPRMVDCTVSDSKTGFIVRESTGLFENCEVFNINGNGIKAARGANPVFRGCRIRDTRYNKIQVEEQAQGVFEDCEVAGNAYLTSGADVIMRRVQLTGGPSWGVNINTGAFGTLEDCRISGFADDGVIVATEGGVNLINTTISECKDVGINLTSTGRCTVSGCEVSKCAGGVHVSQTCQPSISRSSFLDCTSFQLRFGGQSSPTISDCELGSTTAHTVWIEEEATPLLARCKITGSEKGGIITLGQARASLVDCQVFASKAYNVGVTDDCSITLVRCDVYEAAEQGLLAGKRCRVNIAGSSFRANAGYGIQASGEEVSLRVEGSSIKENKKNGVHIQSADAVLTNCEFDANEWPSAYVQQEGRLTLQDCKVLGGKSGLLAQTKATALVQRCTFENTTANTISFDTESTGLVRDSTVSNSQVTGVVVTNAASAELANCAISDSMANGIVANTGGNFTATNCNFVNNAGAGVAIFDDSRGTVTGGKIESSGKSGVHAKNNAAATIRDVTFAGNPVAVEVGENGHAAVYGCTAAESSQTNWKADPTGELTGADNTPPLNSTNRTRGRTGR